MPAAVTLYPLIVLFSVIWGFAFVVGKPVLAELDPPLYPAGSAFTGRGLFEPPLMAHAVLLGMLNKALSLGLSFTALQHISSARLVIIVSVMSFFSVLIEGVFGLVVGFGGMLGITRGAHLGGTEVFGILNGGCGDPGPCSGYGFFIALVARFEALWVNCWRSSSGGLLLLSAAFVWGMPLRPPSLASARYALYLALAVTVPGCGFGCI